MSIFENSYKTKISFLAELAWNFENNHFTELMFTGEFFDVFGCFI